MIRSILMFISRECDYSVRIIRELADGTKKTAEDISTKERISYQFSYKILKKLETSGLVRVYRGVQGGYALTKSVDTITLYDVFTAIEDQVFITACLQSGFACPMNQNGHPCTVHKEFMRLQEILMASMKEKTLAQIFSGM
jgi:Rrf2 family protein